MNRTISEEEHIFCQAIEIPDAPQRAEFLQKACGGDHSMKERIEQLLEMHFSEGRILDETRDGSTCESVLDAVPSEGDTIANYKLLQEIGEGGMGVVFMAQQTEPVQRKVAIKIIKVGMDTRRVVARFESERQALAMMEHPCITKVLDAGATETGRPYFVMELVRGKSITEYCDEKQISLPQRLELFVKVCRAVEHAHQKGIIHRDIKPTNIMVTNNDGVPLPKIIDFGIAKATDGRLTDKTLFTNYGEMIGTPLYMSPEQAEMSEPDVDTRTDIYSLGVLLYELLTGTTPFDELKKQSFHDIRDAIRSTDPQLASTRINKLGETLNEITENRNTDIRSLQRFVRGDLDWILMKCLARDRRQRYQSSGELADEIGRYLHGEPVEAAAPTLRYRARKFVGRHRAAVLVTAAMLLMLVSGTVFSTAMAFRANTLAKQAQEARRLADDRLVEVAAERDRARAAEKQLAALERRQRNEAAIVQAIAMHNAKMVKRHLAEAHENAAENSANPSQSVIEVKPMSAIWQPDGSPVLLSSDRKFTISSQQDPDSPHAVQTTSMNNLPPSAVKITRRDNRFGENLEVVVVADEGDIQADLLKLLAQIQRESFGDNDVIVAQTLNKLAAVMAHQKDWEESAKCYREAMEIIENLSGSDREYLSEIRLNLARALKNKGDIKMAMSELQATKTALKKMKVTKDLSRLFDQVRKEIDEDQDVNSDSDDDQ